MARPRKEVKKPAVIEVKVEPEIKERFFKVLEKKGATASGEIYRFIRGVLDSDAVGG